VTRKDFELIADVFAYCEAHCDDPQESHLVRWIADHMADALAVTNDRFDRARFMAASLPLATRRAVKRRENIILWAAAERGELS
jgi:hypothetical protein